MICRCAARKAAEVHDESRSGRRQRRRAQPIGPAAGRLPLKERRAQRRRPDGSVPEWKRGAGSDTRCAGWHVDEPTRESPLTRCRGARSVTVVDFVSSSLRNHNGGSVPLSQRSRVRSCKQSIIADRAMAAINGRRVSRRRAIIFFFFRPAISLPLRRRRPCLCAQLPLPSRRR
jgi:hypothetical protein